MQEHWEAFGPPVYIAVAGYLKLAKGETAATRRGDEPQQTGNLDELVQMFSGTGGVIQ